MLMAQRAKASCVFLTLLLRKALCSYHVLNFRMPEGLCSYKLCSYNKKNVYGKNSSQIYSQSEDIGMKFGIDKFVLNYCTRIREREASKE